MAAKVGVTMGKATTGEETSVLSRDIFDPGWSWDRSYGECGSPANSLREKGPGASPANALAAIKRLRFMYAS
jgi:hypothetical protein